MYYRSNESVYLYWRKESECETSEREWVIEERRKKKERARMCVREDMH